MNIHPNSASTLRIVERIKKLSCMQGECWTWIAAKSKDGYGRITVAQKNIEAHRVSYEVFVGPIPAGLEIDHLCRNRACVNPDHLEPVSHQENSRRVPRVRATHCRKGHAFDEGNTYTYPDGRSRQCRACWRETHGRPNAIEQEQP